MLPEQQNTQYQPQNNMPYAPQNPSPKKKRGLIIGISIGAILLITAITILIIFLVNKPTTSDNQNASKEKTAANGYDSPEAVGEAYLKAYETVNFSDIIREGNVCKSYAKKYGLDASQLELSLQEYDIKGSIAETKKNTDKSYDVNIALTLTGSSGTVFDSTITVNVYKENNRFTFCGESKAQ